MYYVYILKSIKDNGIYTGYTKDIENRLQRHHKGQVAATKSRLPLELVVYFTLPDKTIAFKLEQYLKSGSGRAFINKHFL